MKKLIIRAIITFIFGLGFTAANAVVILEQNFQTAGNLPGSLPSGWTTNNVMLADGTFGPAFRIYDSSTANAGSYWPVPEIGVNNRFAGANDDAEPCDCDMSEVYLQTPSMNFSASANPAVTFNIYHDGNYGGGDALLQISTDGGFNWIQVDYPNDLDGLFTISEGVWQTLVITLFEFGGNADVRLRFVWSDAASWASGFAVDNVVVGDLEPVSLTVERAVAADWLAPSFGQNYWDYSQIPLSQVSQVKATGVIYNSGLNPLNNASVNFEVLSGSISQGIWSASVPSLNSLTRDTLSYTTPYVPSSTGTYTVKVSGNAGTTELNTTDNVATSSFDVTECTYARDAGSAQAFFQVEPGDVVGNLFDINQDQTFYSIEAALGAGSTVGGNVIGIIYELLGFDNTTGDPIFAYVDGSITVEVPVLEEDLNTVGGSDFVCLPFESPVTLTAGGVYWVAVVSTDILRVPVSGTNNVPGSWVYVGADDTYGWTQGIFMIRLLGGCNESCQEVIPGCTELTACNYNPLATFNDGTCTFDCPPCESGAGQNIIWSNDFSNPSTWIIAHDGAFNSDFEIGPGLESTGAYGTPAILSTTANNGYAMYNSDGYNNSAGVTYEQAHITTASPINLSQYSNVILQFETQYRRYTDEQTWLIVSTDGTFPTLNDPMMDISGMPNVFRVWEDGELTNSVSPGNPTIRSFNISEIAGNAPQVWIRLQFTGIWGYAWYIDDISIREQFQYDANLSAARLNFASTAVQYGRIPFDLQPSFYNVNTSLSNSGVEELTNVTLELSINNIQSNTTIFNDVLLNSATLLPGDEVVVSEDLALGNLPIGDYAVTFQLQSSQQACDGNTTNNTLTSYFSITNLEFSIDSYELYPSGEELLSSSGTSSFTDNSDGFMVMSYYDIVSDNTPVFGLQVLLANETVAGSQLRVAIHDTLNIFSDDVGSPILESNLYTITGIDISNGSVYIPFGFVNYLQANGYYASVELFSQNNTLPIRILDVLTIPQPGYASLIYLPSDFAVYSNGNAFGIRLILAEEELSFGCINPQACNFDISASADDGSCFFPGDGCNDGNAATTNDIIQSNCQCAGTLFVPGCTNSQACNYNPTATVNDGSCLVIGSGCNDFNSSTINDVIQPNCECEGTVIDPGCTGFSVNNSTGNPSCAGLSNGFISVNVAGTSAPFSYSWSNGSTGSAINNVGAGTYSVTITDALGCAETLNFNLSAPQAVNAIVTATPATCFGASTGSASVSVTGGTAPYTYAWTTAPIQNTAQVVNVPAGNYTVNITDANGCVFSTSATISEPSVPLSVTTSATSATCSQSDGTATAAVTGSTGPVQYLWSNGQTGATATNLPAGNYTITVTSGGCSAQTTVSVNNTNAPIINHVSNSPQCFGDNTGSINTIITGGTQPYQYLWSNGGSGTAQTGLSAGDYTFIVIDNVGCQASIVVELSQPAPINISLSATPTSCTGIPQGAVNATVSGGTQPYLYSWSNGSGGTSINNLSAGQYSLTITDASGCDAIASTEVINPNGIVAFAIPYDVNCINGSDGSIEILITEGTPPFDYAWSNGEFGTSIITNLQEGDYSCTITDAAGCTYTATATVDAPQGNLPDILGMSNVDPFSIQTYSVAAISGATLTWAVTGGNILSGQGTNFIQVQWSDEPIAAVVLLIFYPNGCQASVDLVVQIGMNTSAVDSSIHWNVFPNPTMDVINIELTGTHEPIPCRIIDISGRIMFSGNIMEGTNKIDLEKVSAGMYTLELMSQPEHLDRIRILKQ